MKTVLTIAGFDPSGGAGILADIKTISRFDCYGVAVITSVTFQNTMGVFGANHQTADSITRQLRAILDDFDLAAVKIGMLPTREAVQAVAEAFSSRSTHLVVDPVITSSSGFHLIDDAACSSIVEHLFPIATVVTPNIKEAEKITGTRVRDRQQMEQAARQIQALGAHSVLVTGGDLEQDQAFDLLLDHELVEYSAPRVEGKDTHGTGCAFSSALACLLASGHSLRESVPIAKQYVVDAIKGAPGLGHGRGPMDHFLRR